MFSLLLFVLIISFFNENLANFSINCAKDCFCRLRVNNLEVKCFFNKDLSELPDLNHLAVNLLDLSHNHLDRFPREYARQTSLYYLDLSYNNIAYLEEQSLFGFQTLRVLNLSHNHFRHWSNLNPNTFLTYTNNLEQLNLNGNKLNQFNSDQQHRNELLNSEYLKVLLLDSCEISDVGGSILAINLPKLETLSLNHNPLKEIKPLHSSSLNALEMRNCSLCELSEEFLKVLPRLQLLDLAWNPNLKLDSEQYLKSPKLKSLDLSFCNLEEINLAYLPQLIDLKLEGNRLHSLTEATFTHNSYLETLDLSENSLRYLHSKVFRALPQLAELNLAYNELARLEPKLFQTNTRLIRLNLARNAIEDLNGIQSNSLNYIDLSWCEILYFDLQFFQNLPNIIDINLSNNLLKHFPDNLHSKTLETLNLSNCRLSAIQNTTFSNFPHLKELKLNGNRFTTSLMVEYFVKNKNLDKIWLGDNPWICNCRSNSFKEFYKYLNQSPKKIQDTENLQCVSPDQHFGKYWHEVCDRNINTHQATVTGQVLWTIFACIFFSVSTIFVLYWIGYEILRYWREKRAQEEFERNQEEINAIRCYNERMLSQPTSLNALSTLLENSNLPSYEDALEMPKPVRSAKSLGNLRPKENSYHIQRICTTCSFNEMQYEMELGLRYQNEEVLLNRSKERALYIEPLRRTDLSNHDKKSNRCRSLIADNRYPASNVRAQNLQSAEQIANLYSRENSPYSKRKSNHKTESQFTLSSLELNRNCSSEEDYLEIVVNDTEMISKSPFARRKPKILNDSNTRLKTLSSQSELLSPVETHFEAIQRISAESLQPNDYQIITLSEEGLTDSYQMSSDNSDIKNNIF